MSFSFEPRPGNKSLALVKSETEKIGSTTENSQNFESTTDFPDDPTAELYSALHQAHQYYNKMLFGGELKACLLTINYDHKNALGYFCKNAFKRKDGLEADEISINPAQILLLGVRASLQTLVHEMCHQWHDQKYKPSHRGYHSKKWAAKMNEVGLKPISLDKPGKETGYRVTDRHIPNGKFHVVTELLMESGFDIEWGMAVNIPGANGGGASGTEVTVVGAENQQDERAKQKRKHTFACPVPGCDQKVWGKASTAVDCTEHKVKLQEVVK